MSLAQSLKLALKSLAGSKMRAFLTMLGIIIGVASVIILVSLMEGMTRQMTAEFEKMGTNRLSVEVYGMGPSRAFKAGDMDEIFQKNRAVFTAMSPKAALTVRVTQGTQAFGATTVAAVSEQYRTVEKLAVAEGRFLAFADMTTRNKVCVIGPYLSARAFGGKAVGKSVKLNGDQYKIVGVLAPKGNGRKGTPDDTLLVPYTLAPSLGGEATAFAFATVEAARNTEARKLLEGSLYAFFHSKDAFFIMDPAEIIKSVDKMNSTMTMVLVGIAAISLLVGGIGIMNIMLVSVTERTREIGIRKSLGAKRRDIMRQFVIEAATTSTIGGVLGILLGAATSVLAGRMLQMPVAPAARAVLISFGISVGIGVFFGFMPANKASRLNPIDALRHD